MFVMALEVMNNNVGYVIPPHFPQGLMVNAKTYIKLLDTVVKQGLRKWEYIFQQDSLPHSS